MSTSCRLTVQPDGRTVAVAPGVSVLQVLQDLNIAVRSDCGGAGVCGKCRVRSLTSAGLSPVSEEERSFLGPKQVNEGYRLACRAMVTGDAAIAIPQSAEETGSPRGKKIQAPVCTPDPAVCRIFLAADQWPEGGPSLAWAQQLLAESLPQWPAFPAAEAAAQLVSLAADVSLQDGATLVCHEQQGVSAVFPGHQPTSLGLAVDLGTTTIAAYLCDLQTGQLLASRAMFNPQRKFGDDVISRISSAVMSDTALGEMQQAVAAALDRLAGQCLEECGLLVDNLDELVVVGNTTMQTIFAGDSPESLGMSPYLPPKMTAQNLLAGNLGMHLGDRINVYLFPVISGFLGGDSVAVALGGKLLYQEKPTLYIDIGTNGELLLGCGERIVGTSCATGPALEGAEISCGMRAVPGAIDRVEVDDEQQRLLCHWIGESDGILPLGICGSGLIDTIACLREIGALQESGRLNAGAEGIVCDDQGLPLAYRLVPAGASGTGQDITLSLRDIRAFQLAKSALVVGIEKLLEQYGLDEALQTCITGAFGAHFNWHNGLTVDLLSAKVTRGKVSSGANLAGAGAMMALLVREKRREAEVLASRCKAVELAADPDFNQCFVERTRFPSLDSQSR